MSLFLFKVWIYNLNPSLALFPRPVSICLCANFVQAMRVWESEAGQALHTLAMFTCISTSSHLTLCKPLTKPFVCLLYDLYLVKQWSVLSTVKPRRLQVYDTVEHKHKEYVSSRRVNRRLKMACVALLFAFSKPNSLLLIYFSWLWYEWNAVVNASLQLRDADWEVECWPRGGLLALSSAVVCTVTSKREGVGIDSDSPVVSCNASSIVVSRDDVRQFASSYRWK